MGEENRDDATGAEDFGGGGKRLAEVAAVEGGVLWRRNEAGAVKPVCGFSSGVLVSEVTNQRLPRGKTSERTGAFLA